MMIDKSKSYFLVANVLKINEATSDDSKPLIENEKIVKPITVVIFLNDSVCDFSKKKSRVLPTTISTSDVAKVRRLCLK
jgi:hypothetical protein